MKLLFILLAQSVTGAVITIVALLLVAAIIGYFTAWFYAKSIYTPVIKGLEDDKAQLKKEVTGLKDTITDLHKSIDKLNDNVGKLQKEIEEKNKEIRQLSKVKE